MRAKTSLELYHLESYICKRFWKAEYGSKYFWFWADRVKEVAKQLGYHDLPVKCERNTVKGTELNEEAFTLPSRCPFCDLA